MKRTGSRTSRTYWQEGPKPGSVPMIALVRPSWVRYDSVDDDSEPEQVDQRQKGRLQPPPLAPVASFLAATPWYARDWPFIPMFLAFGLGLGCTALAQLLFLRRN